MRKENTVEYFSPKVQMEIFEARKNGVNDILEFRLNPESRDVKSVGWADTINRDIARAHLKWFNKNIGFGFAKPDPEYEGFFAGQEVFVHKLSIRNAYNEDEQSQREQCSADGDGLHVTAHRIDSAREIEI